MIVHLTVRNAGRIRNECNDRNMTSKGLKDCEKSDAQPNTDPTPGMTIVSGSWYRWSRGAVGVTRGEEKHVIESWGVNGPFNQCRGNRYLPNAAGPTRSEC